MAKNILVLGARGYLGEHLVQQLAASDFHVLAAARPGTLRQLPPGRVTPVEGDLADPVFVGRALQQADAVFFAAGRTWQPGLDIDAYQRQNVGITRTFFEALGLRPQVRVLFTSSLSCAGGSAEPRVYAEDSGRDGICESWLSPYDRAKIACEELALASARRGNQVILLNPGLMLGPGATPTSNLAAPYYLLWYCQGQFAAQFYVNGGVTLCDVRDVARAHVAALQRGQSGQRYFLGGHDLDRKEFYARVTRLTGLPPPRRLPADLVHGLMVAANFASFLSRGWISSPVHRSFARTQGLYYFGASGRAAAELDYTCRPMETTLLDLLHDYHDRGLLPAALHFLRQATPANASALVLLQQLARRSGYAAFLLPRLPRLYEACQANRALQQALLRLQSASVMDDRTGRFRWGPAARLDVQTLQRFFEYVYFSSNEFLREVM